MKTLVYRLPRNLIRIFSGANLLWQFLAAVLTYIIVSVDLDWKYFIWGQKLPERLWLFPAVLLGGLLPILVPLVLLIAGRIKNSAKTLTAAFALAQAAVLGLFISGFYKAFTGRIPPPEHFFSAVDTGALADTSHGFQFGLWRGGVFWGWPSTHTTIAFAMALVLYKLYPKNRLVKYLSLAYALYVGLGVSLSIHWFSEFAAGAIIGSVIGAVVGESFWEREKTSRLNYRGSTSIESSNLKYHG